MTLEEAIKHCKDVALSCTNKECALEHFQLLKWLQEYSNMLEKQDEQKPFDYENANIQQKDFAPNEDKPRYSIGDVLCDKSCTTLNKDAQPNFEIVDIKNGMYICDKCSFPISQQDEYELVAKKIEQKPAWSEEDENRFSNLIFLVKCSGENEATKKGFIGFINRLKFIRQQISDVWSEEDEEMCQETIDWFEKKCFPYALESENPARESIKWLKSLKGRVQSQNQWKPSEEQMEALKCAVYDVAKFSQRGGRQVELENEPYYRALHSLYGQLKSL